MWNFSRYADRIAAISEDGTEYSYAFLTEHGDKLAEAVGRRCLVFCLCSNSIGALLGYTSFINHHIVPLMIDEQLDKDLLNSFLEIYKPDFLWASTEKAQNLEGKIVYQDCGYALIKRNDEAFYPLYEDLALLITTSGSTGSPKFVRCNQIRVLLCNICIWMEQNVRLLLCR